MAIRSKTDSMGKLSPGEASRLFGFHLAEVPPRGYGNRAVDIKSRRGYTTSQP